MHLRGEAKLRHASLQGFSGGGVVAVPFRRKAVDAGIFDPAELALLGRVFEQLKPADQSADARDRLASRIIANYMAGVVDEAELITLSRLPLGR